MAGRGTDIQLGGNLEMHMPMRPRAWLDGPRKDQKAKAIEAEIAAARKAC